MISVPSYIPKVSHPTFKLAIVGDCPTDEDVTAQQMFAGSGGRLLRSVLGSCGLPADLCYMGYVLRTRPPGDDLSNLSWDKPEIQDGLARLASDINAYRPNAVLLLGAGALRAARPDSVYHNARHEPIVPVFDWRGSIIPTSWGPKAVVAYDPNYVLKAFHEIPLFRFDCSRAKSESASPELERTAREIFISPTVNDVVEWCSRIRRDHLTIGFDIEGICDNVGITCLSFFPTPHRGIVIPFFINGEHYWKTAEEEAIVWGQVAGVLADPNVKKVCHMAMYETFVTAWRHKMVVSPVGDDTMIKHWEKFPELERSLAVATSLYTREPYYKNERTSADRDTQLLYNGKDSAVTVEINNVLEAQLIQHPKSYEHYRFNISLVEPITYMMLRGCRFDQHRAAQHLANTEKELDVLSTQINDEVGRPINVKSTPDKQFFLYEYLGYEPYKRYGKSTKEEVLRRYFMREHNPILQKVIQAVALRTRISDIKKLTTNDDGRLRTSYDLVGTDTGRIASRASSALRHFFTKTGILKWDSTGTNLQNVTFELRDCFIPDNDAFDFWQLDLSGADGWTVAADLAALGHPEMLDDYLAGIKPAKLLLLLLEAHEARQDLSGLNSLPREELKRRCDLLKFPKEKDAQGRPGDWKYLCMKRVQHGTNYMAEPATICATIFKDSDGLIDLPISVGSLYQRLYLMRYSIQARVDYITKQLSDKGFLQSSIGIKRQFYGIRNPRNIGDDVIRAAQSFDPQAVTTYVTNSALKNLWENPANRKRNGFLFVEPLLQIHDANAGQYGAAYRDWAHDMLRNSFKTTVNIHGIPVTIPAEGGYGRSWKDTTNPIK